MSKTIIPAKPFYMIRHGESEANKAGVFAGHMDSPLTNLGRTQAEKAREILEALENKPDIIIHSHLSRAKDTAQIMNKTLKLPMIENPDLAEIFYGDLQGTSVQGMKPYAHITDPPGGETQEVFRTRIRRGLTDALMHEERVLIVGHGGCFRAMGGLYGSEIPGIKNAVLYKITPNVENKPIPWDFTPIGSHEIPEALGPSL